MSTTTIDRKVVEMRFDNAQFEKNVSSTLTSLAKLKQNLNLTGASKGLEGINSAAKNVNMSVLGNAVETVHTKFSALEVMGVTALANITNQAVNAGKRIASALTIDPIKTGFKEYETQINAVQTILANTQSKGTTIDDVNSALDTLNEYADKTIYNFTEMTRNIGTFTAAGVDLDTSVNAIQGIANLAAVSGSTSQQASTAMYQLSQALSSGTVKLMDWNSVVNAGMGGQVFQDALKDTARVHGIAIDDIIAKNGSFRDSLHEEWLTSEILTETLQKFTLTTEGLTDEQIKANREMLKAKGYTEAQIDEIFKLGNTSTNAATKVKTFTQLWDVLKESAQSGWSQTWELIFGDFEEAKDLFTPLADFLTGAINSMSKARNTLIEGALNSPFGKLAEKIEKVTGATDKMSKATKDYAGIVDKVIDGEYGDGQARWDKLAKEGYDWAKVQNLVNEKLGDSTRHTEKLTEAQKNQSKSQKTTIEDLVKMSDAQLKKLGFEKEEITALRELEKQSKLTGIPLKDLVKDLDQLSGRELLINSFKNAGQGLVAIFKAMKDAWVEVFPPMTSTQLYNIIASIHKFSTYLTVGDDTADKLKRTLKGLFSILGIVSDITGGALKIAFKALTSILGYFDTDILSVTANIGDALVKFREMTNVSKLFDKAIGFIIPLLIKGAKSVGKFADAFGDLPIIKKIVDKVKESITDLKDLDFKEIGKNIIKGLKNGLGDGASGIVNNIIELGKSILNNIRKVLGIHSPSTEFFEIGQFIIQGLVNGIQNGISSVLDVISGLGTKCAELLKNIDWGTIFAGALSAGMLITIKTFADALSSLASPFEGLGSVFEGTGKVLDKSAKGVHKILISTSKVIKSFSKVLSATAFNIRTEGIKNLAVALGILVAAVVVLTFVEPKKLRTAVAVVGALAAILLALVVTVEKIAKISTSLFGESLKLVGVSGAIIAVGASLLLIAMTVKMIGKMDPTEYEQGFKGLTKVLLAILSVLAVYGLLVKGKSAQNISKLGSMLVKMAISIALMVGVCKLLGTLNDTEIKRGGAAILVLLSTIAILQVITKYCGTKQIKDLGNTLIKLSISIAIMVGVCKLLGTLNSKEIARGGGAILVLLSTIAILQVITKYCGTDAISKLGTTLLSMTISIALMVGVCKLLGTLNDTEIKRGGIAIAAFLAVTAIMVKIVDSMGNEAPKLAGTILAISAAVAILAGVSILLSLINPTALWKGVGAVGALSVMVATMTLATRGATDVKGTMMGIAVAIGIMVASIAVLSFIKPEKLVGPTIAIGVLMGMFALIVKSTANVTTAIAPLAIMTVIIGLIGVLLIKLSKLPVESVLASAASLGVVLLSLSGAMVILGVVGSMATAAIVGAIGLVGVIAILTGAIVALGALTKLEGFTALIKDGGNTLALIGHAIGNFIGSIVGGIAAGIASVLPSIGASLSGFMVNVTPFITGVKQVDEKVLASAGFLAGAIIALTVADVINGIASIRTGGLGKIGTELSEFMINADAFIKGASSLNAGIMTGAKALAETVLILTAANVVKGLTSWFAGDCSLSEFGEQLAPLGTNIRQFAENLGTFNEKQVETVNSAANAIKAMATAANEIPNEGGWLAKIVGDNSIDKFGSYLPGLGTNLSRFAYNLGTFTETQVETVKCAANAIKVMSDAANEIPNEGGWLAKIVGDNSIDKFGSYLPGLATNLSKFASNLGTFTEDQVETVKCAANAIKAMSEAANEIPNEGGWLAKIVGDNSIEQFGSYLPGLGTNLNSFATNLGTFTDAQVRTITCAANAIKAMAEVANTIPNEGGWISKIVGENSLDKFGKQLADLGYYLSDFVYELGEFDDVAVRTVNSAVKTIEALAYLADSDLEYAADNLEYFGDELSPFGSSLSEFYDELSGITNVNMLLAEAAIKRFKDIVNDIKSINTDTIKKFNTTLKAAGTDGLNNFVKAFAGSEAISNVERSLTKVVNAIVKTVKLQEGRVEDSFKDAVTLAANGIKDPVQYDKFMRAGKYLVNGFVAGIDENAYKAKNAAISMAKAAEKAAKEALKINSPSKVFTAIGGSVPEGFAMGIDKFGTFVTNSVDTMADSAVRSVSTAISNLASIINNDIDAQPAIRPVLDLSGVESGVGVLNGMFGMTPSIGTLSSISSISSMMNKNQNGSNNDVISAINDLKNTLSNGSGDTYNINGVTYDDGSNVSDAIKTIVRAAKIERRT